jgi:hypothetical protein
MEACKPSKLKILLALVYMFLIMMSSLIPMHQGATKLRFLLQVLSYSPIARIKKVVLVLGFSIVFGILNELVQMAVPGRYAGLLDIMLNCVGSALGIGLFMLSERRHSGLLRRVVCG